MGHFAEVVNGIVQQVIVAEQDFIDSGAVGDPARWVQTSYNTHGGEHPEGRPLRKNYAGGGHHYDGIGFYAPQPYPSWKLNRQTYLWEAPIPKPPLCEYCGWDEQNQRWVDAFDPTVQQAIDEARDEFNRE